MIQNFLRKLLTVDLPSLMVLPKRLEISIPPSITSLAEAAVGRDTIMRAVASAVLEADALEQALDNVLPLGRQGPAGGVMLPESFTGELSVSLREGRDLEVSSVPWQSNPYCRLVLGSQVRAAKTTLTACLYVLLVLPPISLSCRPPVAAVAGGKQSCGRSLAGRREQEE